MSAAVHRFEVRGRTTEEAEAALATVFPGIAFGRDTEVPFDVVSVTAPGLGWLHYRFGGPGELVDDNHDAYLVATTTGRVRSTRGRSVLPLGAPGLLVEDGHYESTWERAETDMVTVGADVVRAVAARYWGRTAPRVLFRGEDAATAGRAAYWNLLAAHVRRTFDEHPEAVAEPAVLRELQRHVAMTLLGTFPNALLADPPRLDVHGAVPATVRRALEYIDDHAHEAVTVDDVAAAAHLSTRGLQVAFRRALGSTPSEALRRTRLDGAHRDLHAADPDGTTVAAVAHRWGFAHAGRFAARYRSTYGEDPSATLRR
ncbi:helix-turn-helix domain-containing protein [Cellulomonas sp. Y8]|uniref:helix-turn-helix domain-containing protein n=1 Tax=Cellulomonas sp. Y8 TaxID=2591145 RepID=UPI003D72117B